MNTAQLYDLFLTHPRVTIDSRQVRPGDLFFAIKGERFDGNQFAAAALEQGAAYAVVDDPGVVQTERYLCVADSLRALQALGRHHRRQFQVPVVGIGGSNGKTTTKELVGAVLSRRYHTHVTPGNLNNHIGLPLTLLAMPADTEVAVVELGANHQQEIAFLCTLAEPTHGLITNVGKDHLEGFGGIEGVKRANAELFDFLTARGGMAFVNRDEPYLEAMAAAVPRKLFYQQSRQHPRDNAHYEVQMLSTAPFVRSVFLSAAGDPVEVNSQLIGRHNFQNIMTAITLGKYFKVAAEDIRLAIEGYQPRNNRSQLIRRDGATILLDAYNANPSSVTVALETLAQMPGQHKIAILGDMLELGEATAREHREIVGLARRLGLQRIILVGELFRPVAEAFSLEHFPDVEAMRPWFREESFGHATLLIKGSRSIGLEKLLKEE